MNDLSESTVCEQVDQIFRLKPQPWPWKKAVVTGASSGIGLACAAALAEKGTHLVLVARRRERLEQLREALLTHKPELQIDILAGDMRSKDCLEQISRLSHDADVLVNNAGLAAGLDPVEKADPNDWAAMLDTNVTATAKLTQSMLRLFGKDRSAYIVNIGSIAGYYAYEKGSMYCASKHALLAFHRALRAETCDRPVRCCYLAPGMVDTEFSLVRFKGDKAAAKAVYAGMQPLRHVDIAQTLIDVLSRPDHVTIDEILITPRAQGSVYKVVRT